METSPEDSTQFNDKTYTKLDTLTTQIYIHNDINPSPYSKYTALIKKKQVRKPLLSGFDVVLCLVVLSPCVVGVWRGVWQLMDMYPEYFPVWQCLALGLSIHFVFAMIQDVFNDWISKERSVIKNIMGLFLMRIYIYIFAMGCIMHWRGSWMLMNDHLGIQMSPTGVIQKTGSGTLLVLAAGCFLLVIALRSFSTCLAPPFVFAIDKKDRVFTVPTRFKTKMGEKTSLYILDCLFSVLVIGTLVVFVWRGAWALIDIYLFPENELWSSWASLIVGYTAVAIAFMLQPFMKWLCDRITGVARLLAADLFLILSLIGTVNVWRGIWNLLNFYLLPDNLELSCWITHWLCLVVLVLLGCSNSLLVRGVYIDAEEPAGKCVVFPCYYLRMIFREQKLKKMQKEQNKTEMANVKPFENNHVSVQGVSEYVNHKEGDV